MAIFGQFFDVVHVVAADVDIEHHPCSRSDVAASPDIQIKANRIPKPSAKTFCLLLNQPPDDGAIPASAQRRSLGFIKLAVCRQGKQDVLLRAVVDDLCE